MDYSRQPYFPPPPGQAGNPPPPIPLRPETTVPAISPPHDYSRGQFQQPQTVQSPQYGGQHPQQTYQPTYGAPSYHQSPPNSHNYHQPSSVSRPEPTPQNFYSNGQPPYTQPYSPSATYTHPNQRPSSSQSPSLSSALQQATSLFSDSDKVVKSYHGLKSKARAKFTQFVSQGVTPSQPTYNPQVQYAQNHNSPYNPSPSSTSPVHPPGAQYHQTQQSYYQHPSPIENLATPPAQSPYYHPPPSQEQAYPIPSHSSAVLSQQRDQYSQQTQKDSSPHHLAHIPQTPGNDGSSGMPTPSAIFYGNDNPNSAVQQHTVPAASTATHTPPVVTLQQLPEHQQHIQLVQEGTSRPIEATQEPGRPTAGAIHPSTSLIEVNTADCPPSQPHIAEKVAHVSHEEVPAASLVDQISTILGNVSIGEATSSQSNPPTPDDVDFHDYKRALPRVTENGEPNAVVWECPADREVKYETDWYHISDIPNFLVCTHCHERCLAQTPLGGSFIRTRQPEGRCRFNAPRITRLLLPECLKRKDITPLREFMTARLDVLDCKGVSGADGLAGIKWYQPLDDRLDGFVSCEACYQDIVLATSFRDKFVPHDSPQASDAVWACDICLPFISRSIVRLSKSGVDGWNSWVEAAAKHIALPECDKGPVSPSSRRWMRLRGERHPDFKMCEKCYEKHVALTTVDKDFESIPHVPSHTGLDWMDAALGYTTTEPTPITCSMNSLPVEVALTDAKGFQDINVLYRALEVILSCPPCTERGIINGTWYTLTGGGCDGYRICAPCHAAFITPFGLDRFYEKSQSEEAGETYFCSFERSSAPRWVEHMNRNAEAVETGVWSRYSVFVRKFAGVPHCAKENLVDNRRWYGWDDCTICPECYITFCQESSPPPPSLTMEFNNDLVVEKRMCCLYSPRMRQKWIEACEAGKAEALIEFSRVRHGVWVQTVLQVQALRQMQDMQMMNAMHAGFMSVTYQGIEGIKVVSGTTDGHEHGNSQLGWHATEEGATSAAFRNQMQIGMAQSNSSNTWMTIWQLLLKWSEYE
ncbi:hypothetical protein CPAR01_03859 [Colletotrichum paranaense]|uniref:Integral membrane protein n=1 Tax=Colletotrichum paranaense TaxID=1914294 RepID=A0ABQ9SUM4_9PEZI|nr:uncharacterized protein CPAR01_03859 [Colletotrichum paranaense]KAK1543226.1 hypothetical protein CPAR01_03859 [Colletotrichum paranaense]